MPAMCKKYASEKERLKERKDCEDRSKQLLHEAIVNAGRTITPLAQKRLAQILDSGKFSDIAIWRDGTWTETDNQPGIPQNNSGKSGREGLPYFHINRKDYGNCYAYAIHRHIRSIVYLGDEWNAWCLSPRYDKKE